MNFRKFQRSDGRAKLVAQINPCMEGERCGDDTTVERSVEEQPAME